MLTHAIKFRNLLSICAIIHFMKKPTLTEIFNIFALIGVQLLGGGYVIVPLLKKYIVDERNWMSEDELVSFYAMSQCIPGIIAGNIAVCAGYKARRTLGAIAALAGIIFPPFIAIILLANLLKDAVNYPIVQEAFWGIRISVIILIIVTIKDLWKKSVNSPFGYILFFTVTAILLLLPISPAIIIILSALAALALDYINRRKNA